MKNLIQVIITGLAGTGTSTLGESLAKEFGINFYSTGQIFRDLAVKKFPELEKGQACLALDRDPWIDLGSGLEYADHVVDKKSNDILSSEKSFILDSRIAWFFAKKNNQTNPIKILLFCEDQVRFGRISQRQKISFEEAKEQTIKREFAAAKRFKDLYGLQWSEITNPLNHDLCIDTFDRNEKQATGDAISYINSLFVARV
jgi:cytidylate kinase